MKKITNIYIFIIAILIGVEFSLGAIVAPTIFYPTSPNLANVLNKFLSGTLMSEIFIKYNSFLIVISIIILVYEMVNFNNNLKQNFAKRLFTLLLGAFNLALAITFILYFSDFILNAQKEGIEATQTAKFALIHKLSEYSMILMMLIQTILFFIKLSKGEKDV